MKHVAQGWPDAVDDQLKPFKNRKMELSLEGGCLLWGNRVVVPEKLQDRLLQLVHDGHPGIGAMKSTARSTVWWPGMDRAIESAVSRCQRCQQHRGPAPPVEMRPWRFEERPWTRIHIDYAGPIEGKWILIVVDSTSKWIDAHVTSTPSTAATIGKLRVTFATHGLPSVLVTDNAAAFTSEEFAAFLKANGVRHLRSPAYHPSSNGQAESAVKVVKEGLKKYVQGTLEVRLTRVLFKYRTTPHTTAKQTPAELLMGRRLRTHLHLVSPDLRGTFEAQQDQQMLRKRSQPRQFEVGDPVFVSEIGRNGPKWQAGVVTAVRSQLCEVTLCDGRIFTRHLDHVRTREAEKFDKNEEERRTQLQEERRLDRARQTREVEERERYEEKSRQNREEEERKKSSQEERSNDAAAEEQRLKQAKRPVETEERTKTNETENEDRIGKAQSPERSTDLHEPVDTHPDGGGSCDAGIRVPGDPAGDFSGTSPARSHRYALRDRSHLRPPDRYGQK